MFGNRSSAARMFGGILRLQVVAHRSGLCGRRWVGSVTSLRPLDVLYFGTDEFSVPSLEVLCSLQKSRPEVVNSVRLVTRSPKWCGRQHSLLKVPPVFEAAKRFAMPLQPFECDGAAEMRAELLPWLQGCDPAHAKMLVAVSYGRLIPQEVIAGADYSLNVHPSLLPRYKGSAPIQHTLLNGDTVTGVSLQTLHPEKFDHGEVIARTPEIPVNSLLDAAMDHIGAWKTRTLIDQLGTAGSLLLREVLLAGTYAKEDALDTSKYSSSWARTIKTADKQVDFARDTAEQVYNKLSVLGPVYAFKQVQVGKKRKSATEFTDKRVLIHEARPVDRAIGQDTTPGTFTLDQDNNTLLVECAGNTQLAVRSLQFEACAIETPTDFASRLRKRCGPIQAENCIFTTECTHESLQ